MAFSKKHFEATAAEFQRGLEDIERDAIWPFNTDEANATATASARKFAKYHLQNLAAMQSRVFAADNPNFDRARFLRACGF